MRRTRLRHGWEMERTVTSGQDCVVLVEAENGRSASISLVLAGVLGGAESSDTFCGLHSIVFKTFYHKITRNYRWGISSLVVSLITIGYHAIKYQKKTICKIIWIKSTDNPVEDIYICTFDPPVLKSRHRLPPTACPWRKHPKKMTMLMSMAMAMAMAVLDISPRGLVLG